MSVKQLPNGEWVYRFNFNKRGYRKQGFRTRVEAETAETHKKSEVIRRHSVGQSGNDNLKLCEAADMFFEEYALPFKRNCGGDRAYIKGIKAFFGERRIKDITPRDMDAFRIYISKNVKGKSQVKVSLHTVNRYHAGLKASSIGPKRNAYTLAIIRHGACLWQSWKRRESGFYLLMRKSALLLLLPKTRVFGHTTFLGCTQA